MTTFEEAAEIANAALVPLALPDLSPTDLAKLAREVAMNFRDLFKGHVWRPTERTEDHIAATGFYRVCARCGTWMKLRSGGGS